jgi:2-succinyl-5-enolpyruvyl-6-hydroxy-3-cyclohexene-1-carboxylate synthase
MLREHDDALVIDNYDSFLGHDDAPQAEVVIRFGRWPVSKRLTQWFERTRPMQIAVDPRESRDFTSATDVFIRTTPGGFVSALLQAHALGGRMAGEEACSHARAWVAANDLARERILGVAAEPALHEGVLVRTLLNAVPDGTLVFAGNSMAVRALDTFMLKEDRVLPVLCNRGLNGIDGTLSTAFGAAQFFKQTVVLVGDITALHDINALALQGEMRLREREGRVRPSILVVCLENGGGAIFDMLPQASDEPYFERLFLTPQQVDFGPVCQGFNVPYAQAATPGEFEAALGAALGVPGISFVSAKLPLRGVRDRYGKYW